MLVSVIIGIVGLIVGFIILTQRSLSKKKETVQDYFTSDRDVGYFNILGHLVATMFSAFIMIGLPGLGWQFGYSIFILVVAPSALGFALNYYFLGRRLHLLGKEYGFITPTDLLASRYESKGLGVWFAVVLIISMIPFLVLQMVGVAYLFPTLSDGVLPYWLGLVIMAGIISYLSIGGQRAVIWTDTFCMFVLGIALIIMAFYIYRGIGYGYSSGADFLSREFPKHLTAKGALGIWTYGTYISWFLIYMFSYQGPQHFRIAYFVRNLAVMRKTVILMVPVVSILLFISIFCIGVMGRAMWPKLGFPPFQES